VELLGGLPNRLVDGCDCILFCVPKRPVLPVPVAVPVPEPVLGPVPKENPEDGPEVNDCERGALAAPKLGADAPNSDIECRWTVLCNHVAM